MQGTAEPAHGAGVIDVLREALGTDVVSLPAEFSGRRHADSSRMPCAEPVALLRPRTTEQVATALRICHEHGQPVVTQGGLSGLAGGACLLGGEVALSLELMNAIEEIDPVSATMTVQAGVPLQSVQEAAAAAGFMFPLDLGARGSATIGGNLATNAGGNRVIRYGMMREQALDIEAVLADGSVIGGRRKMIKNNTGYDLRNLLIGSEGTLGVITRAVLRLRSKSHAVSTAWCGVPDYESVTALLRMAQERLPAGVSAFEVMWPGYYDFVLSRLPELRAPLTGRHAFYVLLESSGADSVSQNAAFEAFLADMLEAGTLGDAALAATEAHAAAFWAIRDAPGEYGRLIPGRVSFDVSFSIADVGEAARRCDERLRAQWPDAHILIYGHLGDGNLHIVVQQPDWPASAAAEVKLVVYGVTAEMNGSVSAEHGIGTKKLDVLALSRSPAELATMRALKAALDPRGILNPGKLFAS
ncbi:FAD-binding oxidoreductase [Burkholderia anthina]|uniref:FAD-binding oxidoreductase n=1 Tax=Burkholderia anthina TaxID=179879 RepID=A0A6P2G9Q9_9BURK|nr:FAD-binding oxidoreductase [Burkholderia anthina]MBM2766309.1 FAD-binding oxidoreductase [Burkholderia anthina]VVU50450.1 FAD-linked oxidase [Burkholderia anthina]